MKEAVVLSRTMTWLKGRISLTERSRPVLSALEDELEGKRNIPIHTSLTMYYGVTSKQQLHLTNYYWEKPFPLTQRVYSSSRPKDSTWRDQSILDVENASRTVASIASVGEKGGRRQG